MPITREVTRSATSRLLPIPSTPRWLTRSVSALGFLLAATVSPAGAAGRKSVSPHRPTRPSPEMPWTETGGSLPPLPPVRSGASQVPWVDSEEQRTAVHPAIHPDNHQAWRDEDMEALFPKARTHPSKMTEEERAERAACIERHPAGRALRGKGKAELKKHTVAAGDTLWDIAASVLGTDDPAAIARYWPRIHRANRDVIGPDPNLLAVGQVLVLPTALAERR